MMNSAQECRQSDKPKILTTCAVYKRHARSVEVGFSFKPIAISQKRSF